MNDRQEKYQSSALLNSVYDINRALLRSQPTPNPSQEGSQNSRVRREE
ncbi:MAG: hypothetical protein F6K25_27370 [Okeania sp. SIO2G4]|nr:MULTISPECIES: hypothetical protein [unclassified Okeania]NEP45754.1 hypothetical protein [Okeania sp. SIO2H7]NEP75308.1 hypothetical protein [Okeania sp. SIO2G5]NEP96386.1 hypothetical protein [Okeania sp. SIO2F5]NEQ94171.1 hypothetical protein [Okeania sp. SIO2G4]